MARSRVLAALLPPVPVPVFGGRGATTVDVGGTCVGAKVGVEVAVAVAGINVFVGLAVIVAVPVLVAVPVGLAVIVAVAVPVEVPVGEAPAVADAMTVGEAVLVKVAVAVLVGVAVGAGGMPLFSQPTPSPSVSKPCGSGGRTSMLDQAMSSQFKSGGGGGMQTFGYDGLQAWATESPGDVTSTLPMVTTASEIAAKKIEIRETIKRSLSWNRGTVNSRHDRPR